MHFKYCVFFKLYSMPLKNTHCMYCYMQLLERSFDRRSCTCQIQVHLQDIIYISLRLHFIDLYVWRKKNIFLIYNSGMLMLKFRHNELLYNANGIPLHNEFQNKFISLIFQFSCFRMFIDLKHSFVHHIHHKHHAGIWGF